MTGFGGDMTSEAYTLGRTLNPQYTATGNWALETTSGTVNYNLQGVAALLDTSPTSRWNNYKTNSANWAIGAPTLELFIKSYNATHTSEAITAYKASKDAFASESLTETQLGSTVESAISTGYKVKKESEEFSTSVWELGDSSTLDKAIYCGSEVWWWLASPSAQTKAHAMAVDRTGCLNECDVYTDLHVRPLVSVPLSNVGTGTGKIVIGDF